MIAKLLNFEEISKNNDKLPTIFLGSIEQHGPYLPIGTDTLIAEVLISKLEKRLGDKLLLFPTLPFGCSKEHKGFAGTVSIEFVTYINLLKEMITSLFASRFKKILLVSTHGGNDLVTRLVQADINYGSATKVEYLAAFDLKTEKLCQQLFAGSDWHAGSSESSLIAFIRPDLVPFVGNKEKKQFAPNLEGIFTKFAANEVTSVGIISSSPKLEVDPGKGEKLLRFMVDNLCANIQEIITASQRS